MKELILQDIVLNQVRREKSPVNIMLTGGQIITGTIRGFDNETIIIDEKDKQIMIYKSNIIYVSTDNPVLKDQV